MKCVLLWSLCVAGLAACNKHPRLSTVDNGTRLVAMSEDSAGSWAFGYTGNRVTAIGGTDSTHDLLSVVDSLYYDSTAAGWAILIHVVGSSPVQEGIITLTPSKLPLQMIDIYGKDTSVLATFFYVSGTDRVDSITCIGNWGQNAIFYFTYDGSNVDRVVETMGGQNYLNVAYSYSTAPNFLRRMDPFFYLYTYPNPGITGEPTVAGAYFGEIFSADMLDSLTITGPIAESTYGNSTSPMAYTLNADGEITSEVFPSYFFNLTVSKWYYYK